MTAVNFLLHIVAVFDRLKIPYVTVGSFAANAYMDARSTKDADFVLEMGRLDLQQFMQAMGTEFELDPQMSMESVTFTTRYKIKHRATAFEVELFGLSDDPFDQERFKRRVEKTIGGHPYFVLTAEDVVITKLRWALRARRSKDSADAESVLAVQAGRLDYDYIRRWCDQHGTRGLFEPMYERAKRFE